MKTLKIGMLKIKDIIKLGTIVIIRENKGAAHRKCFSKYCVPK